MESKRDEETNDSDTIRIVASRRGVSSGVVVRQAGGREGQGQRPLKDTREEKKGEGEGEGEEVNRSREEGGKKGREKKKRQRCRISVWTLTAEHDE